MKTRKLIYNSILKELKTHLDPQLIKNKVFEGLMNTYVEVCTDEETLQKYVNENGITYEDEVSGVQKTRQEYTQLIKIRNSKFQLGKELFKFKHDPARGSKFDDITK